MTKINEVLNKETLEDVQAVFANAIEDIKAAFEGAVVEAYQKGVTHGMTLGMSVEDTKPKYKTEKRKAKVGERVVVVNPIDAFGDYGKGDIFTAINSSEDWIEVNGHFDDGSEIILWSEEYEVLAEEKTIKLTPNQQRAALIEKAREFVADLKVHRGSLTGRKGYDFSFYLCDAEFILNEEKRTVVCLLRSQIGGVVVSKGIAKCHPDEVFNADIGKAIALARALEIDVPDEFLNAVQPTDAVKGMKVYSLSSMSKKRCSKLEVVVGIVDGKYPRYKRGHWASVFEIIDDTNAQYEVAK